MEDKKNDNFYMDDIYNQDNINQNNSLENNLKNYSELSDQISTIKKSSTIQNTSIETIKEMIKDIKIPYPNVDEIPLIKIKDENYFVNDFDNYIIVKFDDNKFNICRLCYNRQNKFFCKNCNKNICKICYENCKNNNHNSIDLERYLDEVD